MYRVLFLLVFIFLYGCVPIPGVNHSGSIEQKITNDTNRIDFEIKNRILHCYIDSINLTLFNQDSIAIIDTLLFAINIDLDTLAKGEFGLKKQKPVIVQGSLTIPAKDTLRSFQFNSHIHTVTFGTGRNQPTLTNSFRYKPKNQSGIVWGVGLPAFDKSTHRTDVRDVEEKNFFMFSFGFIKNYNRWNLDARSNFYSGRLSDNDKKYLFEILDLGIKYLPRNKFDWTPLPVFRANLSKYKIVYGYNRYREYSFGVGFGLSIEKKFQRYTYTFNTSYGGYHKFDALFAFYSNYDFKLGTQYTFYHGKNLKMFSIAYIFELSEFDQLAYKNDQNFLHKTLSAGPLFPIYWLWELGKMAGSNN